MRARAPQLLLRALNPHRWDEWVPAPRVLKLNDTNLELQKTLQRTVPASAGGASARPHKGGAGAHKEGGTGGTRAGARKDGTRGTKRGREEVRLSVWPLGFC